MARRVHVSSPDTEFFRVPTIEAGGEGPTNHVPRLRKDAFSRPLGEFRFQSVTSFDIFRVSDSVPAPCALPSAPF